MDQLYSKLYSIFTSELSNVNIGYNLNKVNINKLMQLINIIYYIDHSELTNFELLLIINKYEKL